LDLVSPHRVERELDLHCDLGDLVDWSRTGVAAGNNVNMYRHVIR